METYGASRTDQHERGAAAVEFAIILTVLIPLLMGIIEFGWAFFIQGTMAGAAREGARDFAIHKNVGTATTAAVNAGKVAGVTSGMVSIPAGACPITPGGGASPSVTVTITQPGVKLTGFFGSFTLKAEGTMRCNG